MAKKIQLLLSKALRKIYCTYLKIAYRPKVTYLDEETRQELKNKPFIIICNHRTHNDGQVLSALYPFSYELIAKDWMEKPIVRFITDGGNYLPIDRHGFDSSWFREGVCLLKSGKSITLFPEGHTSKNGELDKFKSGFIMLAVMTGTEIVPVFQDGEYHILFGKRLSLKVGKKTSITTEGKGMTAEYLESESERFKNIINEMRN